MDRRGSVVTDADIRRFEHRIGHELPEDYRKFLLEVNGGRTAEAHCTFTMRKGGRIGETTLNALHSLDDPDPSHDLAAHQLFRREDYPTNGLRIGYDDCGWALVLILSGPHRGELWMLAIEDPPLEPDPRVDWFDRRDAWHVAYSFAEFMAGLRPLEDSVGT